MAQPMSSNLLFLDEAQVRAVLTYPDLIPTIRQALIDLSSRHALQPVRQVLTVAPHNGWFGTMPAVYGDVIGAKLVTFYPNNAALQLHTHHAIIQLFRASTGQPLAILDGRLITEMRTAAVSAVAVDHLAPPTATTLAILGSGVQAHSHFAALAHLRNFKDLRIWSRSPQHAASFAAQTGARATSTAEQAVTGADVVITVTSSSQPILLGHWLKPTALVCAVGACTPDRRELDDHAMRGTVIVESREAANRESGDILLSGAKIHAELGELLNNPYIPNTHQPTIFKSLGMAVEDLAAAKLVYDRITNPPC